QFHYYYVKLTGDGVIQARVDSLQDVGANGYQKAAVMIRESLAPDSRHVMMAALANGYCSLQYRSTSSGASNWYFDPDNPIKPPVWIRLTRTGNVFTGQYSLDGVTWAEGWNQSIAMQQDAYVGLVVTSHVGDIVTEAVFSNVTLTGNIHETESGRKIIPADISFTQSREMTLAGLVPEGVAFDGMDDYIDVPASADLSISGDLTAVAWIYLDSVAGRHRILNPNPHLYGLLVENGDVSFFQRMVSTGDKIMNFDTNLAVRRWHHLAVTRDAANRKVSLYINGLLFGTQTYAGDVESPAQVSLQIGTMEGHAGEFWRGKIRQIRLWQKALTRGDIQEDMNHHYSGGDPGLRANWPMNECSGNVITDLAGGHNGTLINGAEWGWSGHAFTWAPETKTYNPCFSSSLEHPRGIVAHTTQPYFYVADAARGICRFSMNTREEKWSLLPFRNALYFDGAGYNQTKTNYMHTPQLLTFTSNHDGFVFEGWFYFESTSAGDIFEFESSHWIYCNWKTVKETRTVSSYIDDYGKIVFKTAYTKGCSGYGNQVELKTPDSPPLNQWIHLAFRFTGTPDYNMEIIKDGVLVCAAPNTRFEAIRFVEDSPLSCGQKI
ncbi:MAG TPA: hypothetical protein PLB62_14485, partial [Candidatus Sumerlaeota bacterium]|nr:hypothetical protein [Candidatus Sumerlaeota bacterium]